MGKWEGVKLSEIVQDFIVPKRDKPKVFSGNIPWCRIEDFNGVYLEKSKSNQNVSEETIGLMNLMVYPINTVIVSCSADLGRCAIIKKPLVTNQTFIGLVPKQDLDSKFLYYLMTYKAKKLNELASGTTIKYLSKKKFQNLDVFITKSLSEQQRIVAKLDGLFAKIDKAIDLLEENIVHTQALMGSVLDEIYSNGEAMFKDVCEIGPKKSKVRDIDDDVPISFLPMKDLNENSIHFLPKETRKLGEVYKGYTYFADGDIIVAKVTPCFENGKAGIAKDLTNGIGFGSSEYHVLRPNDKVLPEWIYFSLITEQIKVTGRENMTGAGGLKRIPRKFLEEWKIPLPKISVQKKQIEKLKKLQEENKNLENSISKKINHLKALKSSFLNQAFKGQL